MAGLLQADFLQPQSNTGLFILSPTGSTMATVNTAGIYSATGGQMFNTSGNFGSPTANTLGIGTTASLPLDVVSNSSSYGFGLRAYSGQSASTMKFTSNDGNTAYGFIQGASTYLQIGTSQSTPLTFATNFNEVGRFSSGGYFLVGATNPAILYSGSSTITSSQFQATGGGYDCLTLIDTYASSPTLNFATPNASSNLYRAASIRGWLTTTTAGSEGGALAFYTVSSGSNILERVRVNQNGSVYFGNSNYGASPANTNYGFGIEANGGSPFINHCATTGTSLTTYYAFINGNGAVGTIKTTGTSTQFNTSSDVRLKKNVVDAPSALTSINQIGIKSFDWKSDNLHQEYGVIAQDLETIAPEAVSQGQTEDEMWGVDYSKLVPRMIKAIQEQQELIITLQNRLAAANIA